MFSRSFGKFVLLWLQFLRINMGLDVCRFQDAVTGLCARRNLGIHPAGRPVSECGVLNFALYHVN